MRMHTSNLSCSLFIDRPYTHNDLSFINSLNNRSKHLSWKLHDNISLIFNAFIIPTSRDCTRFEPFDWLKEKFYTSINSVSKNLGTIFLPLALKIHSYFETMKF